MMTRFKDALSCIRPTEFRSRCATVKFPACSLLVLRNQGRREVLVSFSFVLSDGSGEKQFPSPVLKEYTQFLTIARPPNAYPQGESTTDGDLRISRQPKDVASAVTRGWRTLAVPVRRAPYEIPRVPELRSRFQIPSLHYGDYRPHSSLP
jgi:hypothetical protein